MKQLLTSKLIIWMTMIFVSINIAYAKTQQNTNMNQFIGVGDYGNIFQYNPSYKQATSILYTKNDFNVVAMYSGNIILAGDNGAIIYSNNNGSSWSTSTTQIDTFFTGIKCVNQICMLTGEQALRSTNPVLLMSKTNGANWIPLSSPLFKGQNLMGVSYINGAWLVVSSIGNIFRSTDNGSTWDLYPTSSQNFLSSVSCNNYICVAAGVSNSSGQGIILVSNNRATSWHQYNSPNAFDAAEQVYCDNNKCLVGLSDGSIMLSNNGGISWSSIQTGISSPALGVSCYGESCNIASENYIGHSTNGGITWQPIYIGSQLFDVRCDSNHCIATGLNGYIASSNNAGNTWNIIPNYVTSNILWATDCTSSQCVAVGNNGTVLISSASNPHKWNPQTTAATENSLYGVSCSKPNNYCIASGYNGTIIKMINGNWQEKTIATSDVLFAVSCSGKYCVTIGQSGDIYSSKDSGNTWSQDVNSNTNNLRAVSCNSSMCAAVGVGGTVVTKAISSKTWTTQNSLPSNNLVGVQCSTNQCVAVGLKGTVVIGYPHSTWVAQTIAKDDLQSIYCSSNICIATGENGLIMQSSDYGTNWDSQKIRYTNNYINALTALPTQ